MSHITKVKTVAKDLDALKLTIEKMGLEFRENKTHYIWYGSNGAQNKCDHAIGIKGDNKSYEIGVTKVGDEYKLAFDNYDRKISKIVGNDCNILMNEYTKVIALNEAIDFCNSNNYSYTEYEENGEYIIELNQY